jgi:predicted transcriptional regulator
MKTLRLNTTITVQQKKVLDQLSEQTGAPLTWLIQKAISEYIERRKKEIK